MELQDAIYEEILSICSNGDNLVENFMYDEAIEMYSRALNLVSEPRNNWEASTWIYTALGDVYYIKKDFEKAKNYLFNAMNCPDGIVNPFILLRLGQSLFELNEFNNAKNYLMKAYMLDGYSIFYDEDDKYFNIIKDEI